MSLRRSLSLGPALALLLLLAPAAQAAYEPIGSGLTKLKLDRGFVRLLGQNGVRLAGGGPVEVNGRTVSIPVAGGKFDPTAAKGTVTHAGALRFEAGSRSVPLRALMLKTTQRGAPFSAKVGGGQLKLASAKRLTVDREGFGSEVGVSALRLSDKLAGRLGKKLRLRDVFVAGQPLGSTVTRADPVTVAIKGGGSAGLVLDPGFEAKLRSLFVAVTPIFPAERAGVAFQLPIFGGALAPDASSGRLETSGSLELLQLGGGQVFWQEPWLELDAGAASADLNVQPSPPYPGKQGRLPLFGLDASTGAVSVDPRARTIALSGAGLVLGALAAASLNEAFAKGKGVFQPGEALGAVTFVAQGQ